VLRVVMHGGKDMRTQNKPFTWRRQTLKALIIYDDVASALRASTALHQATRRAKVRARWDIKPWRVDILRFQWAADEALVESVGVDLAVLAGPRTSSLPVWLKGWLQCWASRPQAGDPTLIVIPHEAGLKLSVSAIRELSGFAAQNDLDLIVEKDHPLADETSSSIPPLARATSPLDPTPERTVASSFTSCERFYRGWGINE